jgi:ribosomal protein S17
MNKTIAVTVSTKRNDPLYAKRVGYSKKYYAHDEKNEAKVGDVVTIMACRPISRPNGSGLSRSTSTPLSERREGSRSRP